MRLAPAYRLCFVAAVASLAMANISLAQRADRYGEAPTQGSGPLASPNSNPYAPPSGSGLLNGSPNSSSQPSTQPDRPAENRLNNSQAPSSENSQFTDPYRERPANSPPSSTATPSNARGHDASATNGPTAEELMADMLTRPATSQLSGSPLTLREVIQSASSRESQSQRINAYWDLCSATSDYYLSLHEQNELQRVARSTGGSSASLRDALQRLETRRDTSLTAARASQHRLASLMHRTGSVALPADMPLCTPYQTRFEENFGSTAPPEAAELNRLLPLRHAELQDAAANVMRSEQRFNAVVQRNSGNLRAAEADIVASIELLALNRRAFVQIARDYNRRITRYTELAKPGNLSPARLVAMLIKTDVDATARRSASPTSDPRQSQFSPPSTFRDPKYAEEPRLAQPPVDEEVRPATFDNPRNFHPAAPLEPTEQRVPLEKSVLHRPDGG